MSYKIELIRKDQLHVSKWSGGITTQLAIYPEDAIYSERDFIWRLSSAKVEVEESNFTSLPNINRIIMIIEGKLRLEHEGHHKSILEPFDQDRFCGSWKTISFGKVTDFNLMMREDCEGELEDIHLEKKELKIISFNNNQHLNHTQAIYCVKGQARIEISDQTEVITLYEGDIILITTLKHYNNINVKIHNEDQNKVVLIRSSIYY